ncbi:MAG: TfoX/Sxy family protein [Robiginitalea sp.]|jgi:TfoX/Sxy family transcriptional regulator of competence genes
MNFTGMPYNQQLEIQLNEVWLNEFPEAQKEVEVKKMFGGLVYLYRGKMTVGIVGDDLMARVPKEKMQQVLGEDSVRPMEFTGRPLKEFVFVEASGFSGPGGLVRWITLGLDHARIQLSKK